MMSDGKEKYIITLLCSVAAILFAFGLKMIVSGGEEDTAVKVGFIYVGDASDAYTSNFAKAQHDIENLYADRVETVVKYNIPEDSVEPALRELVAADCRLIFTTSYGYGDMAKKYAEAYPDVEFCQATCSNANEEPLLPNYHTFMGRIHEGRYISGVVAGLKLGELINDGTITREQVKIGYIAAFPMSEVISGYTAFFLGIRSVVPEAVMTVKYTNTWSDYQLEKTAARELIEEDCVIISQHSDTSGPASACEETDRSQVVYYVSYNESMRDIAPTTYLTGSKINWSPYMVGAVKAVLSGRSIESTVSGVVNGNDVGAGFDNGWISMLETNEFVAAMGTTQKVDELIDKFSRNKLKVFYGDYTGTDPFDPNDTIDLREGYIESENSSAPTFHYVLDGVITIEE